MNSFFNPTTLALLGMSQGLLAAGSPSRMPISTGGALAQGMGGALNNYMLGHKIQQDRDRMALMQAEEARRATQPIVAGPGSQLIRPGETEPFYSVPFKPEPMGEEKAPTTRKLRIGNEEVTQEFVGGQWREVGRGLAFSPTPLVNIDNKQEGKFSEKVGTEFADQYTTLMKADMNAPASIAKYQRLGNLLSQVNTGKFKGATTDLKASAKSLGIDLTALGIADDVAPAQAARALSNQIALELRNPAGGAGMPGALSDKDREFLLQSIPGLENDPQAIGKMIEYRVKLAQREQEVAKKARAYRKKNGRFDEGFYDELADWSAKNTLFPDQPAAPAPAAGGLSPQEKAELEDLRRRLKK